MVVVPDYVKKDEYKIDLEGIVLSEYKICGKKDGCRILLENNTVVFVLKGKKILKTKNREYFIEAGNILFLGKDSYISSQVLESGEDKYEVIMISIDDSVIHDLFRIHPDNNIPVHPENDAVQVLKMNPFIESSLLSLLPYFGHDHSFKKTMMRNKIIELLVNLIDADHEGKIGKFFEIQRKQFNSGFRDMLLTAYSEPLTVQEFAKKANMSLSSFKKKFNETFNMPPKVWINRKRLEKALRIVKKTNYSITEICFLSGFENLSYFIRSFKKEFGETPKRMQLNNK